MIAAIIFALVIVVVLFVRWQMKEKKYEEDHVIIYATYNKGVLHLKYSNGETADYEGDCTLWRRLPYMFEVKNYDRIEELMRIHEYIKWHGNPYPTAHENKANEPDNNLS